MKAFLIAAVLLYAAPLMAQTGEADVARPPDPGSSPALAISNSLGTTSYLPCMPSCTATPIRIYVSDEKVDEWEGTAYVTISISPSAGQPVSVKYMTKNGTAKHPKDYDKVMGTMIFLPGEAFKKVAIPIVADNEAEPEEDFFLELSNPINASIADASGEIIINGVAMRPGAEEQPAFAASALPNPSSGDFLLSVSGLNNQPVKIRIYDGVGRLVMNASLLQSGTMRVGREFGRGMYTIKVMQGDKEVTLRVVKL